MPSRYLPGILVVVLTMLVDGLLLAQPVPSQLARLATESLLLDGDLIDESIIAVGERGHILLSKDLGKSWVQVPSPVNVLLTAIHRHDRQLGFVTGHDGVILRTQDGGQSWELVHYDPENEAPLLDIWFKNALEGFAVGAYGLILHTKDGGESWEAKSLDDQDYHLNSIIALGPNQILIAGESGIAYRSDDGGSNWSTVSTDYSGSWFDTLAQTPDTLYLSGLQGSMSRSFDLGANWERLDTQTTSILASMAITTNNNIIAASLDGLLLLSRDRGDSFQLHQLQDRVGITSIIPMPNGELLLMGESGMKWLTDFDWYDMP
ncbi:MAG: YCF48-related protein [Gammaproteobacteria bacterium]|nr:YCF48-related protein [Gammaproteobacteria bacterium]